MPTTNFFSQLAALGVEGDWQITIKAGAQNRMIVSALLKNENVSDSARKLITPMLFKGTCSELDDAFFDRITQPAKQTSELFVNMQQYAESLKAAKENSELEKNKEKNAAKEKDAADKKYAAAMKKVDELEKEGKFREAYANLPKKEDFPVYGDQIDTKKKALIEKFEQPGLFDQKKND